MVCGYQWLVSPDAMLQGRHCPECIGLKRKNTEEYKNELASLTDKIICLDEYVNSNTKIKHQCITCGHEWFVIPSNLLRGSGCPKCAGNLRKTDEEYRNELAALTDTILCVDEYINDGTKILHRCITCGHEWLAIPTSILRGTGCLKCANIDQRKKVRCIETEIVYNSLTEAAKAVGLSSGSCISQALKYGWKSGGYHWEYADCA